MSTVKTDAITAVSTNGDLSLDGLGTGGVSIASTLKMAKGGDISSASPLVIDTDGNYFDVTGTTNFSAMTVEAGNFFMLQFDGALTITHGSGIELPGAANLTTATGDRLMCYATASNTVEVMSVETEAAASSGGMVFISSVVASGAASIDFDGSLTSTYDRYVFIGTDINPATDQTFLQCRTDSSGGGSWDSGGSDYSWVAGIHNASSGTTGPDAVTASAYIGMNGDTTGSEAAMGNAAEECSHFEMWVNNPSGTTFNKIMGGNVYVNTNNAQMATALFCGTRLATAAIDSIQFLMSSGNIDGTVRLYGIVDS